MKNSLKVRSWEPGNTNMNADGELIPGMTVAEAADMLQDEVLRGGMIPKVQCAIDAVQGGAEKVHIIDGRVPHAILLELLTDSGVGTEIARNPTK